MPIPSRRSALIGLVFFTGILNACSDPEPFACTASVEPGIRLEVRDSVSGDGLGAEVLAMATDVGFSDSLRLVPDPDSAYMSGLDERAGTYDLTITLAGYQTWNRNDVVVNEGACHVHTVDVFARLVH
jgi:hypothetical protein